MKLKVLGSSSHGNSYVLTSETGKILLIEAGLPWNEIKRAIGFDVQNIEACIISHEHKDHAGSLKDVLSSFVTVAALPEVFRPVKNLNKVFQKDLEPMKKYQFGEYSVFPLLVKHDVPCLGFVISHKEMGRLAFFSDTMMIQYKVPEIGHWLIEANYSDEILDENIANLSVPASQKQRLMISHMEIGTTETALMANDLTLTKDITLIHLSDRNSSEVVFKERIEKATGKPVYVAKRGLELTLNT